ncbi:MAG: esterase [Oligoflexia bacterium]|nr:esterase [Oligoflexia bacterium]
MYKFDKIGPLEAIDIPGNNHNGHCIVMMHGYGADANDLVDLSHVLKPPPGTRWLIPNGPLKIPVSPFFTGRAWAPINLEEWQKAMAEGRPRDLTKDRPKEFFESQNMILQMLEAARVDFEKTIFAGFSQGAMLATQLSIVNNKRPLGLMIFSGTLINDAEWATMAPRLKEFKFFQCHGEQDEVLHISGAKKLEALLKGSGWVGNLKTFSGGHDIPAQALQAAQQYLNNIFPEELWGEDGH